MSPPFRSPRGTLAAVAVVAVLGAALPTALTPAAAAVVAQSNVPAPPAGIQLPAQPGQVAAPPGQPPGSLGAGLPDAAAPAEDIRGIRGPKYIIPAWLIPAVIVGVVLLGLAGYGLWRWLRRRRQPRALLPFEVALQRLENIRELMQPPRAREFSIAVSDIVRTYIEQRFDVVATHRTTEEFLHDLLATPKPTLARHRGLLSDFLQQCDLVKFGGMALTLQNMESLHGSARAFVRETAQPDPPVNQALASAAGTPASAAPAATAPSVAAPAP